MYKTRALTKIITGALLSGVASAGLTLGAGTAQASWPGCPPDQPQGPCRWCPGEPPVRTGNMVNDPVIWDNNVCHTYYRVDMGQGNVANSTR